MSADKTAKWKRWLPALDRNDAAGIVGAMLITAGLWQIYPPAALIVLGSGLVVLAVRGAKAA